MTTARNIEIKARLSDLAAVREFAAAVADSGPEIQRQVDTYFAARQGRLKLREINGRRAELIWYERPDQTAAKGSAYIISPIADAESLKAALAGALGVRVVVAKRREIYLVGRTRIHLDQVDGLGDFFELEAVLSDGTSDASGKADVARLLDAFGISSGDLLEGSYADMMRTEA